MRWKEFWAVLSVPPMPGWWWELQFQTLMICHHVKALEKQKKEKGAGMIHYGKHRAADLRWRYTLCDKFHAHNKNCGMKQWYWRDSDEVNSYWRGAFLTFELAVADTEEEWSRNTLSEDSDTETG